MRGERDDDARRAVIEALLGGESVSSAARIGKVARQTVYQWRDRGDPEIEAALERASELRAGGSVAKALAVVAPVSQPLSPDDNLALDGLRAVLKDDEEPGSTRVAAAKALLDHGHKMRIASKAGPGAPVGAPPKVQPDEMGADEAAARFRVVS